MPSRGEAAPLPPERSLQEVVQKQEVRVPEGHSLLAFTPGYTM